MTTPPPDAAARFYQRNYETLRDAGAADNATAAGLMAGGAHRYSSAWEFLSRHRGLTVLEMGYGGNGIVEVLAPLTAAYHLVDIVDRTGGRGQHGNVRLHQANLDNPFPFADASFDAVLAMMVIEHMYDPFHAFAEVARVARPGAHVFVNLPNIAALRCRLQLLAGRMPVTSGRDWFAHRAWDGNHLHSFTVADVRRLAGLFGLQTLEVRPVGRLMALKRLRPSLLCHEITYRFRRCGRA